MEVAGVNDLTSDRLGINCRKWDMSINFAIEEHLWSRKFLPLDLMLVIVRPNSPLMADMIFKTPPRFNNPNTGGLR